jgi:hypothetical protein
MPSDTLFRECGCEVDFTEDGRITRLSFCYPCSLKVDIQLPLQIPLASSDKAVEPEPEVHHAPNEKNGEAGYRS